jgi:outer membrane protein assembly factor BamB
MKKISLWTLLLILSFSLQAFAHDTDIYVLDQSMQQVPPDLLIVLDLSGSMNWTTAGEYMYIQNTVSCINAGDSDAYCRTNHCSGNCPGGTVYYATSGTGHTRPCRIDLDTVPKYSNDACSGPFYKSSQAGFTTDCSRVSVAKRALKKILDADNSGTVTDADQDILSMRLGYMRYYNCGSDTGTNYGSGCNTLRKAIDTPYSQIWASISGESATGATPLASALSEAKLYLDNHKQTDNAKDCRKKFVILITDGSDTLACNLSGANNDWHAEQYKRRRETVAKAKALTDAGYLVFVVGFGADMPFFMKNTLNWAAFYGGGDNPYNLNSGDTKSYPIQFGFGYPSGISSCQNSAKTCYVYSDLVKSPPVYTTCTGKTDGTPGCYCYANSYDPGQIPLSGYAYFAEDPAQLDQALETIRDYIMSILAKSTDYVAPVVPISQMEKTSSGNRMYLAMFKPAKQSFWYGNIKKFGIATEKSEGTETINVGDVVDADNKLVMDPWNRIKSDPNPAKSYWSAAADGGEVLKGGVGEHLANRSIPRNIYTYLGTSADLTDASNHFKIQTPTNPITPVMLGLAAGDTAGRDQVINYMHGLDAYDQNPQNGITDVKRQVEIVENGTTKLIPWILGAFIHSRPLVIHYTGQSVIYVGANDGMLHAFDDTSGEELWAFIPPNLLPNLKKFKDDLSLDLFVDGSPKAYLTSDKKVLIFGERRGGDRYYALDITDPLSPRLLWEISPSTTGFSQLGQTWSTPQISKINYMGTDKVVAFFAGGYDTNQDHSPVVNPDTKGRGVYAIDVLTGNQIWKYTSGEDSEMKYSIPSDIACVDTDGDGKIDRLYVGDMGGRIWRFDVKNPNPASWTGKRIFLAGGKIFYPPDVTLENDSGNYEMVFFGTGDRENPKGTGQTERLYAIKDKNPASPLTESDLVNVTQDLLQDSGTSDAAKTALLQTLKDGKGWYILLDQNAGEKCLSTPIVFYGSVYYTTFTPNLGNPDDICYVGEGKGKVYIVKQKTGNAVFNFDVANDTGPSDNPVVISKSDRVLDIGSGIPSGVIITFIGGEATSYAGIGGGVYSPPLTNRKSLLPISWKLVF